MRKLEPNTSDHVCYIVKDNIYILITDFKEIFLLTKIRVKFEKESGWYWIPFHRKGENIVGSAGECFQLLMWL